MSNREHGSRGTPLRGQVALRLRLHEVLRVGRPDIWVTHALRCAMATAVPVGVMVALGRFDLVSYVTTGALAAVYAGYRPFRTRLRITGYAALTLAFGSGAALAVSALGPPAVVRVLLVAVVCATARFGCDLLRASPPGGVIISFALAASAYAPQRLDQVPSHMLLAAAGGVWSVLVVMCGRLVAPYHPQRLAVARALQAVARHGEGAAGALREAWDALRESEPRPARSGAATPATTAALARLLAHAESVHHTGSAQDRDAVLATAQALRGRGPVPHVEPTGEEADTLTGVSVERRHAELGLAADAALGLPQARGWRYAPLLPGVARVLVGTVLAGACCLALGVDRPYWAMVTTAAVLQATNVRGSVHRALLRALGAVGGVLVTAVLVAVLGQHHAALALAVPVLMLTAEATMARNYAIGQLSVTPMAVLMSEFGRSSATDVLLRDRLLDTAVGVLAAVVAALLVTNRRSGRRADAALAAAHISVDRARLALREHDRARCAASGATVRRTRDELAFALARLRESYTVADGELVPHALPDEQVLRVEGDGHRLLARAWSAVPVHTSTAGTDGGTGSSAHTRTGGCARTGGGTGDGWVDARPR